MMPENDREATTQSKTTMASPANYRLQTTLDLSKNRLLLFGIMAGGTLLLLLFSWLVLQFLTLTRPAEGHFGGSLDGLGVIVALGVIGGLTVFLVLLHESIHGLFFGLLTRERPVFGFRGPYAYAAAPGCLILRNRYLVIGLAPLLLISLLGLALLLVAPAEAIPVVALVVIFNAAGSAGDIFVVGRLLACPGTSLVRDRGDGVDFYRPV
ncbi:MAG TPA: DUF3267 domain-containing protein [Chloroflexota bacterium]|nr:DUF3267 domain-containing protein [Chloroflexota bacterium]